MKLFLIGMMGSGKTSSGKALEKYLPRLTFYDLDTLIEQKLKLTIPQIFSRLGEDFFRSMETDVLKEIIGTKDNFILATGGGTPVFNNNMQLMYDNGLTIYLKTSPEILAQRLWKEKQSRPLIAGIQSIEELQEKLEQLLNQREPYYLQAHIIWDTTRPLEQLAGKLKIMLGCS